MYKEDWLLNDVMIFLSGILLNEIHQMINVDKNW